MPPRIAIPLPTSHDLVYNQSNWKAYADAVHASGGEPVPVALDLSDSQLRTLWISVTGVILPGSPADVDPVLYGQQRQQDCAPADPARERVDRLLLEHFTHSGKPLLGICFGMQMLNVFYGGTLLQNLHVVPVNHAAPRGVQAAHSVHVAPDSVLARVVCPVEAPTGAGPRSLMVNSSHHQAVGIAGTGLRVVARCPEDGVVEAIEGEALAHAGQPSAFLMGVQWHPERTCGFSTTSDSLFVRLVNAAEAAAHLS